MIRKHRTVQRLLLLATAIIMVAASSAASAQQGEDSTRAAIAAARQEMLRTQLERMRTEIQTLRTELARAADDAANARALRTMIESLEQSQRHLEEAIRGQRMLVRLREARADTVDRQRAVEAEVQARRARGGVVSARPIVAARARQGYIGVTTETLVTARGVGGGRVAQTSQLPVIVTVAPGSPAHRAGLTAGDTVVAINERDGRIAIQELAQLLEPDETIVFRVRRGGETHRVPVRVERRPVVGTYSIVTTTGSDGVLQRDTIVARGGWTSFRASPAVGGYVVSTEPVEVRARAGGVGSAASASQVYVYRAPAAVAGARLEPLSRDLALKLGVPSGLLVLTVAPETPSERAGIRAGDVLLGTGAMSLTSLVQLSQAMQNSSARALDLKLLRDGEERVVTLRW